MNEARYQIREGSQSAHCCFSHTVVNTSQLVVYNGVPYAPDGVQQYEPVCECLDELNAQIVCDALNALDKKSAL